VWRFAAAATATSEVSTAVVRHAKKRKKAELNGSIEGY
jgi:hypothetical protein